MSAEKNVSAMTAEKTIFFINDDVNDILGRQSCSLTNHILLIHLAARASSATLLRVGTTD